MKTKILLVLLLLTPLTACGDEKVKDELSISTVKSSLKAFLYLEYNDFQIAEIFSRETNKKLFLKNKLSTDFIASVKSVESAELLFRELSSASDSHLGAVILNYSSQADAQKAKGTIEPSGFFKQSKILTRYIVVNKKTRNLVVYTESVGDELVLKFIESYQ